jgi:hypothetical protein
MIRFKTVTPRTNLLLDLILFTLFTTVLISGLAVNFFVPETADSYLDWHRVHGGSGIALGVLIALHLVLHLAWIKCQFSRLVKRLAVNH